MPYYLTHNRVKELALEAGFELKSQEDGSKDLHPYVYKFADLIAEEAIKDADNFAEDDC